VAALLALASATAFGIILRRMGYNWAWTLLSFVPFVNLAGLWAIALRPWPNAPQARLVRRRTIA
jgi:hypothetical protein